MFGAIAGGIASALAGGAMSKLFGGGQKAASGGIQGDVLATDRKSGSAGMPRPISYAVFCLKKKNVDTVEFYSILCKRLAKIDHDVLAFIEAHTLDRALAHVSDVML